MGDLTSRVLPATPSYATILGSGRQVATLTELIQQLPAASSEEREVQAAAMRFCWTLQRAVTIAVSFIRRFGVSMHPLRMPHRSITPVELLESRIAPAVVVIPVGDHSVTVKTSKGTVEELTAAIGPQNVSGDLLVLPEITFQGHPVFRGSDFSITPDAGVTVRVGDLNATGLTLGNVVIGGDLDQIEAGDSTHAVAIKNLHVSSLGKFNSLGTLPEGIASGSHVRGGITSLRVDGDFASAFFVQTARGSVGTLSVGGSFLGGTGDNSGAIFVSGTIRSLSVTGGLAGGAGNHSGAVEAVGTISKATLGFITGGLGSLSGNLSTQADLLNVTVSGVISGNADVTSTARNGQVFAQGKIGVASIGSLVGGNADFSGDLSSGKGITSAKVDSIYGGGGFQSGAVGSAGRISAVEVTGDMVGDYGDNSGNVISSKSLGRVTVHGRVIGGFGDQSGAIGSTGPVGQVVVEGGVRGGDGTDSGQIVSQATIASVTIGTAAHPADLVGALGTQSGAVGAYGKISSITIYGNLQGGLGSYAGTLVSGGTISKITITGSMLGTTETVTSTTSTLRQDASIRAVNLPSVTVNGDIKGGNGEDSGSITGTTIGTVKVGGSLVGGTALESGTIFALSHLGSVTVTGDLAAGTKTRSGTIFSEGTLQSVTVGGSLRGDLSAEGTDDAGAILGISFEGQPIANHNFGTIVIKGAMVGGSGTGSGSVITEGKIGSVTVGVTAPPVESGLVPAAVTLPPSVQAGTVQGGSGFFSGSISSVGDLGMVHLFGSLLGQGNTSAQISSASGAVSRVTIDGDVMGGYGDGSAQIFGQSIGKVTVGGSMRSGSADRTASIISAGALDSLVVEGAIDTGVEGGRIYISANTHLGSLHAGSILGSSTSPVSITAVGNLTAHTAAQAVAIDSVQVDATMQYTQILAGYNTFLGADNGHVRIGTIQVGTAGQTATSWLSNDVIAGAVGNSTSTVQQFDAKEAEGGNPTIHSQIAKIVIRGTVGRSGDNESHNIVADELLYVKVNNFDPYALQHGTGNDALFLSYETARFGTALFEIGAPAPSF